MQRIDSPHHNILLLVRRAVVEHFRFDRRRMVQKIGRTRSIPASVNEREQPDNKICLVLRLAFPYDRDPPSRSLKRRYSCPIAGHIPFELADPKLDVGDGNGRPLAAFVPVPKASVHENHQLVPGKHEIWTPRKITAMQAEPEADTVSGTTHGPFRLSVGAPDLRHHPAAGRNGEPIHPSSSRYAGRHEQDLIVPA
jgi:hypothetical protein